MPGAIYAEGLVKTFGDVRALDGVDLDVPEGTVLGLLGPNGAGKTTAVRCLTTLLQPDSGRAVVAGIDVLKHPNEVRRSIGLSGQFAAVDEYLTGRENLQMVGQLYQMKAQATRRPGPASCWSSSTSPTPPTAPRRPTPEACAAASTSRPRSSSRPPVMFMDEPTTGLDPRNRQQLWEVIKELVAGGTTLLLTTQYLEEADHLAHDIVRRRPRQGHRPRHLRPAQGPYRRRARRGRRARARAHRDRPRGPRTASARARSPSRSTPASSPSPSPAAPSCSPRSSASWTPAASRSTTSACAAPPSTTSSSP